MNIKQKWLKKKIEIVEREIRDWDTKMSIASVNLRENKQKLWDLMDQLEKVELKEGE